MSPRTPERRGVLQGKVAVVTGAARAIGRATAVAFAREGANITGIDICAPVYPASGVKPASKEDLDQSGKSVEAAGVRWLGLVLDQRDISALRKAAAQVEEELGGIDIVFANAGVSQGGFGLHSAGVGRGGVANLSWRAWAKCQVEEGGRYSDFLLSLARQRPTRFCAAPGQSGN